tara:strand:+ start:4603 stop:4971 length:369 start_codon:yes stop_codon:yes gene_type:complete
MQAKLNLQTKELREILNQIEAKKQKDIANYGKPLKNKQLRDKAEAKKRAIKKTKESLKNIETKLEQKFKLNQRDSRVLDAIRGNSHIANTTSNKKGSRFDNRFNGSANSRRSAKLYHRRKKE